MRIFGDGHERPRPRTDRQRIGRILTGLEIGVAIAIGVVVGIVVGLLGAGGSILTVPALILLLGLSATQATGTSLIVVGIVSSVGLITHARAGRVSWGGGLGFAVTGVPAAVGGGYLAGLLSDAILTLILVLLLFGTAVWMSVRPTPEHEVAPEHASWVRVLPAGFVVGLMTGTLGVGGGFVVVPALAGMLGLPMGVAIGTSQLVLALNAVAGLAGRSGTGVVAWPLGLVFAGGGAVGALVASRLVGRLSERLLSQLFAVLLVVVGAALALERLI